MFQRLIRGRKATGVIFLLSTTFSLAFAQGNSLLFLGAGAEGRVNSSPGTPPDPANIVANFVGAESKVREAMNRHTFKRDVVLQTIGLNGEVTGEYIRNSQFVFDDRGRRVERVLYHPKSTIREMRITKEDIQDLADSQLLGIDISETGKYFLNFAGTEVIESRELFAIDVRPMTAPDPHRMKDRYFVGRVWLDPNNFQIVKIKGVVEPQGKQRFPLFETWREPVMGAFAFPTRTEADDVLHFPKSDVHYRIKVKYYDYKLFGSKVSITEIDDPPDSDSAPPKKTSSPSEPRNNVPGKDKAPKNNSSNPKTEGSRNSVITSGQRTKTETCTTNRTAPPIGAYHWPADTQVKVFFVNGMFTPDQRSSLLDAMSTWTASSSENGSGVTFVNAGETGNRQTCQGCLTISRQDVYKRDKHHYAFFHPMNRVGDRLISAWIDLDFAITNLKALKGFTVHELGHGLGLWDCTDCKKKRTIMNGFPGINKDNGLVIPSPCDIATVKVVYQQERQLALAMSRDALNSTPVATESSTSIAYAEATRPSEVSLQQLLLWPVAPNHSQEKPTSIVQRFTPPTPSYLSLNSSLKLSSVPSTQSSRSLVFSPSFSAAARPK
jgi:hypothetical protein